MLHFSGHANGLLRRWMRVNSFGDAYRVRAHFNAPRNLAAHAAGMRAEDDAVDDASTAPATVKVKRRMQIARRT